MSDEAKTFGSRLLERVKGDVWCQWDGISELDKASVAAVALDVAGLALLAALGKDVSREIAHARAQVSNWGFVGVAMVQRALIEGVEAGVEIGVGLAVAAARRAVGL